MRKIHHWMLAATLICGTSVFTSCNDNSDNPVPAKKKYRLVQRKEVYDHTDAYYITDYGYDDQGRLISFKRVGYNTEFGDGFVEADFTYTYGDHYIIAKHYDYLNYRYTLNDDGLIIKEEMLESGNDPRDVFYFQYEDGRIISYQEARNPNSYTFHWEDDDLMYYGPEPTEKSFSMTTFTRSELSVDHGFMKAPISMMNEPLYMMGYYGKPSKHLESHFRLETKGSTTYMLSESDYTYTIADGHIVELVENRTAEMKVGTWEYNTNNKITSTYTYEEVQ